MTRVGAKPHEGGAVIGVHDSIASKFPQQTKLRCEKCKAERAVQRKEVAGYFARGWPMCCGYTMTWDTSVPAKPKAHAP